MTRLIVRQNRAIPASHLLRLVFDRCASFEAAVDMIKTMPICLPAIFSIAGPESGQSLVIERTETAAHVVLDAAAANHWVASPRRGRARHISSHPRRQAMVDLLAKTRSGDPGYAFSWLQPPILQPDTRIVFAANPRSGRMALEGWEKEGRVTERLELDLASSMATAS